MSAPPHGTIGVLPAKEKDPLRKKQASKRCKQDESPNLRRVCIDLLSRGGGGMRSRRKNLRQDHNGTALRRCSFHSVAITSPHLATEGDIPGPNNVAEELFSKLPSQIGSGAPTQLGLKYGNCVGHYRSAKRRRRGGTLEG